MSILVNKDTKVIVQGITGSAAVSYEANAGLRNKNRRRYTPGKGGLEVEGVPVFNTVREAVRCDRSDGIGHLCAGAVCGGCHFGSGGSRT